MRLYKQVGSPCWYYEFMFDGQTVRKSTRVENRREAEGIAAAARLKYAEGAAGIKTPVEVERKTIGQGCEALKEDFQQRGKDNSKNLGLIDVVKAELGARYMDTFKSSDVRAYISDLKKVSKGKGRRTKSRANSTIKHRLQIVASVFDLENANREEIGAALLPVPRFPKLKEADARSGFLTRPQFNILRQYLPDHLQDFALFGYLSAWRKSAISSLEWSDIRDGNIYLRGVNSKNGRPYYIPIAGELVQLIERRRDARSIQRGSGVVLSNLVFHLDGKPIKEFRKSWASACKKANCSGTLFHDMRRSAARNYIRSGVKQTVAKELGGWKTDSMFTRYDITDETDLREAVQKLEQFSKAESAKVVAIQR